MPQTVPLFDLGAYADSASGTAFVSRHLPLLPSSAASERTNASNGVVYTKPWVAEAMLDLSGYQSTRDLAALRAVEPAAGQGAFLLPMARRLLASCRQHGRRLEEARDALLSYELDSDSAGRLASYLERWLIDEGATPEQAEMLCSAWLRQGDYLLEASGLPPADFVIGNPPYVRLEEIGPSVASVYRNLYPTMTGRSDLYVAFFEAALRQLRTEGVCVFICADRWMLNSYGAELRRLVTSSFAVEAVIEMHNAAAFDQDVNAYPAITVIRHAHQGPVVVASVADTAATRSTSRTEAKSASVPTPQVHLIQELRTVETLRGVTQATTRWTSTSLPEPTVHSGQGEVPGCGVRSTVVTSWFKDSDPWPCTSPERLALLLRLEAQYPALESPSTGTSVGIGVATGCDEVFLTRDSLLVEPSRLLPLAMAGDVGQGSEAGCLEWSGRYLVNPWDETGLVELKEFPRLAAYFEANRERLQSRSIGRRNPHCWHRTIDRIHMGFVGQPKLYIPDIKGRIAPVLDEGHTYPHHNLYWVRSSTWDIEVLGGILLSQVAQFFVECYGVRMRGGYLRFQAQYLRRIRVPHPEALTPSHALELKRAFRGYDSDAATEVVCDLYSLSRSERAALFEQLSSGAEAAKAGKATRRASRRGLEVAR